MASRCLITRADPHCRSLGEKIRLIRHISKVPFNAQPHTQSGTWKPSATEK